MNSKPICIENRLVFDEIFLSAVQEVFQMIKEVSVSLTDEELKNDLINQIVTVIEEASYEEVEALFLFLGVALNGVEKRELASAIRSRVDLDPNVRENIVDDLIEEEMQLLH